jgi:hypothetical protein
MEDLDYKSLLIQVLGLEDTATDEEIQAAAETAIEEKEPATEVETEEPAEAETAEEGMPKKMQSRKPSAMMDELNYAAMKSKA